MHNTSPEPGVPIFVASPAMARQLARLQEVVDEGERAHAKHGDTSMRSRAWNDHRRMTITIEELGELARPMNDLDHGKLTEGEALALARVEALQVAAMALDWLTAIDQRLDDRREPLWPLLNRWLVAGPEREWCEWVPGVMGGPTYSGRDVYLVEAPDRKSAMWAAYRRARETRTEWFTDLGSDHPLKGALAKPSDENPADWGDRFIPAVTP